MIGILKAIGAWIVLMLVGTNIIGFVVRGIFWTPPQINDDASDAVRKVLTNEVKRISLASNATTIFWALIFLAYLGALYHFWNILLAGVGFLLMCSRLPDLLWEIRHGKKITMGNAPKHIIYSLASALTFLCLPLTWFALNKWN